MISGRVNELQYLNTVYAKEGSQILVVYGQKNIGKTMLLRDFMSDKDAFYYHAKEASERQQLYLLSSCIRDLGFDTPEYPTEYYPLLSMMVTASTDKKVFIFDEFEAIIKNGTTFMEDLLKLTQTNKQICIILCSSSIAFIENGLVPKIGKAALSISGFLKMKELKFTDLRKRFPNYSFEDSVILYSILGGIPGLWNYFDPKLTLKENICRNILRHGAYLQEEGARQVKEQLREPAVYSSILAALAQGKNKLNDLYLHTEFSRAKISVYLKNLMELELVEKVFSFDTPGKDNQKKGIYRISNHFVHFWFKYLYPNFSNCYRLSPEKFYDKYILPTLKEYGEIYYAKVCREYMLFWNQTKQLNFQFVRSGYIEGKTGTIDFVSQNEENDFAVGFCDFSSPMVTYEEYEEYCNRAYMAKIKPKIIYLMAVGGFDEKLCLEAKIKDSIVLISMKDF